VGITPELLPVIITIGLSHGAMALVQKHVVVRRLEAIEDLGNVEILCADKTGTLTENQVSLIRYLDAEGKDDDGILLYSLLCNSAVVQHGKVKGSTIDSAIWTYALPRFNLSRLKAYPQIERVPFDYERKRMSVAVEKKGSRLLITKGAPECMLAVCSKVLVAGKEVDAKPRLAKLKKMTDAFNAEGYRVIVVAYKKIGKKEEYTPKDETGLVFMGFLTLMDPPKKDALPALDRFRKLGVEIYVLTGDSPIVTSHVCGQVGVENKGKILMGADIAKMSESELRNAVEKNNIYSRLTPSDKLAIVNALRANGHIVGFIGDGVNDAPSLRAADVGISVNNGADIAKDAADVVLLRKSLNVVANGISEGRKTFGNIIKYINNTISANFGNMFSLTIASLFMPFIPLLPSQILFNNFLSDVPMLTVSTDNVDREDLKKPKRWDIGKINRFMVFFGLISSAFDLLTMAFVFFVLSADAAVFRTVWFLESVLSEMFVMFPLRTSKPFYRSMPSPLLIIATILAAGAAIGSVYSPLAPFFSFAPLTPEVVGIVLGIVGGYVIVVEIAKHIFQRMENHKNGEAKAR
jgi:Mg2+-importing ATPase